MNRWLIGLIVVIAVAVPAAVIGVIALLYVWFFTGPGPLQSPSTGPTPSPEVLQAVTQETSAATVKINGVRNLPEIRSERTDTIYTPKFGKIFLACNVTITNQEPGVLSVEPDGFRMEASNRNIYRSSFTGFDRLVGVALLNSELMAGGSATGDVVFEVDPGANPTKITYFSMLDTLRNAGSGFEPTTTPRQ